MNLTELDKKYQDVEPAKGGYQPLPDGTYVCRLEKAQVKQNKGNDGLHLALVFVVDEGSHKGRRIFHHRPINNNEKTLAWLKRDLLAIGYTDYLSRLPELLPQCLGRLVKVELKTVTIPATGQKTQVAYLDPVKGR
ncbi:DUF669 domain-containing protein [Alicyclobacillus acidocaldarius]|uniref:DUF669 domain-containing protein n=1 Tax=Alicyclobacillus acidocaldarius (strain Tc-4-1) TaxID=1048834 RepID=F8IH32_ALIAT|nr:DUF669 domain-containing protein [Alicyclobacillus acidocaldarius]AEJ44386.1 hypothetical protein TC41_2487 [Alicyclobacillus acidocaldarius subsp. acidocaldarius Tc-4-1]